MRASIFTLFLKRLKLSTEEARGWPNYERALEKISKTTDLRDPVDRVDVPVPQADAPLVSQARGWRQGVVIFTLVCSDILFALAVWEMASFLQSTWQNSPWGHGPLEEIAATSVLTSIGVWVGMRALFGLYPGYGLEQAEQLRRQTYAVLATLAIAAVFALAFQVGDLLSRLLLGSELLGLLLFAPIVRDLVKQGLRKAGLWGKPIAVVGAGKTGAQVIRALQSKWGLGYKPVAVFDNRLVPAGRMLEGVPYRGTLTDAMKLGQKQKVDTVIFAMPNAPRDELLEFVSQASLSFPYATVVPNLAGVTTSAVVARDLAGTLGVEIKHNLLNPWAQRTKRALDLFVVVVGGLLMSPLLLAIAALIKLDSPGPVFYGHQRLGGEGKHFRCWKFRTMRADAESSLTNLLQNDAELRSEWERYQKLRNDPRITRMGRFLRKTSLDELPQLWNVLRREMSLVGPRPIVDAEVSKYGEVYELYQRVAPGISGLWQVNGRSDMSYEERVATDAYYVRNWSIWLDLVILGRTIGSIIFSRGAL